MRRCNDTNTLYHTWDEIARRITRAYLRKGRRGGELKLIETPLKQQNGRQFQFVLMFHAVIGNLSGADRSSDQQYLALQTNMDADV
jgi:hypothetical protein